MPKLKTPLRRLLFELDMTQAVLARKAGLSKQTINRAFRGDMSNTVARKIAAALEVEEDALYENKEE